MISCTNVIRFLKKNCINLSWYENDKKVFSEMTKRKWKQKYYLNPDEKLIVMVGRICKSKGMFAYLEAFKNVLKYDSNCRLVVIGDLCNAPDLLAAAGKAVSKVTLT